MHICFVFFFDWIYILSLQHTVYIKIITAVSFVVVFLQGLYSVVILG